MSPDNTPESWTNHRLPMPQPEGRPIPMDDPLGDYLTLDEAAVMLRHNRRTIQRWIATGKLESLQIARRTWVTPESIRTFIDNCRINPSFLDDVQTSRREKRDADHRSL